jgi:superfamily II DNA or RNA helicase
LHYQRCTIEAATGSGKTEMAAATIQHLREMGIVDNVLYLAPTGYLMEQAANKFEDWGVDGVKRIGYGHRYEPDSAHHATYVGVVDSIYRLIIGESTDVENVDLIILDEAHHASANKWQTVCREIKSSYRVGFTATAQEEPGRYSHDDLVLIGLTGPIVYRIRSKQLRERGYLAHPFVTMIRTKTGKVPVWTWNKVYDVGIVLNKIRNSIIASLAACCYKKGYKVLIFVSKKKHGDTLGEFLSTNQGCECIFVQGGKTTKVFFPSGMVATHSWSVDKIAEYINERDRAVVITTTVLDEGLDVPVVNVLIMATGMKKYRRTVQRCGRGMRPKKGDNRVYIFDFWDENHIFLQKQSEYRLWTYQEEEFDISESLDQTTSAMGIDLTINREHFYKVKKAKGKKNGSRRSKKG